MPLTRGRSIRFGGYLHRDSNGAAPSGAAPYFYPSRSDSAAESDQDRREPDQPVGYRSRVTSPGTLALATRGLRKSYGSRVALAGLDLSVPSGVVYGFLGPNGAGKTTKTRYQPPSAV